MPAAPLAAIALPALKPNQPTQSMPAPVTVVGRLCGGMGVRRKTAAIAEHQRGHQRRHARIDMHHRAAGEIEKAQVRRASRRPRPSARPARTPAAARARENSSIAAKRMRSAKAPTTSAGVMMAKVIWNMTNTDSGSSGTREHGVGVDAGQKHLAEPADHGLRRAAVARRPEL